MTHDPRCRCSPITASLCEGLVLGKQLSLLAWVGLREFDGGRLPPAPSSFLTLLCRNCLGVTRTLDSVVPCAVVSVAAGGKVLSCDAGFCGRTARMSDMDMTV